MARGWPCLLGMACLIATLAVLLFQPVARAETSNVEFRENSEPEGIVSRTTYPELGTYASTMAAPTVTLGYRFTHWTVDGIRINDLTGRAANPAAFTVTRPCLATAHYLPETQDSDTDGLVDAFEIEYFGNLDQTQASDPDGDGYDIAAETRSSQHPSVFDERIEGGVSRRRSLTVNIDELDLDIDGDGFSRRVETFRGYNVAVFDHLDQGGLSRRRSDTKTVVLNSDYVQLVENSDPPGVVNSSRIVTNNTTVLLSTAPESSSGYRYTGWFRDGKRFDRPTQKQPVPVLINGATTMIARYISETADTDADGTLDWIEWLHFNSLTNGPADDPDQDMLPSGLEIFRGYIPSNSDDLMPGGVSRRRSVALDVDLTGNVVCRFVSVPQGLVSQTIQVSPGATITSPDLNNNTYSTYRFAYWDLGGVRQTDPSGVSVTKFSFSSNSATSVVATAHYADINADDDFDGLPDWYEFVQFGTMANSAVNDGDGDGMTWIGEYQRGYSPRVRDTLAAGGVSRRRSLLTAVNTLQLSMPPDVTLNSATEVGTDSARLNAWVNPRGLETTLYFEYGLSSAYGVRSEAQALTGVLGPVPVFAPATNLAPATVYHFRVTASNEIGQTVSPDGTFSTMWETSAAEGFEDGSAANRWQITGAGWQVGAPGYGPGAAYAGTSCAGTGLQTNYLTNVVSRLISPLFAVPALEELPQLYFSHWWSFASGDFGTVEVREGTTGAWQPLATYSGAVRMWYENTLDLSAFAGKEVQVAFRLQSNADANTDAGWFVDDVGLLAGALDLWSGTPAATFEPSTFWTNWTVIGYGWECGTPASGPGRAFEGDTCAGTALAGNYGNNSDTRLVSRFFYVPEAGLNPRLRFWQWYNFGSGDRGDVEIRELGGQWQALETYTGNGGTAWSKPSVNLSDYAGAVVQVAFRLVANASGVAPGWYVDAAQLVTGPEVLNNPETFDGDMGDWYLDNAGLWQVGRPTSGPGRAFSGNNVAATVLGGNYPGNSTALLQSPAFAVADPGLGRLVTLNFQSWHQYGTGDSGQVLISQQNGAIWSAWVPVMTLTGNSAGWQQESLDLSAYRGKTVRVGFQHVANGDSSTGAGWYLDDIGLTSLVLGEFAETAPVSNILSGNGARHYYTLNISEAGPLSLDLSVLGQGATAGVYLRRAGLPTLGEYDYRAATPGTGSQHLLIPFVTPGTYYVMVYAPEVQVPSEYTLTAKVDKLVVQSVAPALVDARQTAALTITGAGFLPGVTVELLSGASLAYTASDVEILSLSSLRVSCPAGSVAQGRYGVRVTLPGQPPVVLPDAVEFKSTGEAKLTANLIVPSSVGRATPATIYIEYKNEGDAPMAAPLFSLSASGQSLLTLDQQKLSTALWTTANPSGVGDNAVFFANSQATLEPGETGTVPVYFAGLRDASARQVNFECRALLPDNAAVIDWASLKSQMQPATIPADAWEVLWANFTGMAGSTWGSYQAMLASSQVYLNGLSHQSLAELERLNGGLVFVDWVMKPIPSDELLAHRFLVANGLCPLRTLASGVDASLPAPGMPLVFARTFPQGVAERFALGPLGRGWYHGWEMKSELQSDGAVEVVGPGTARRRFEPDTRRPGQFFAVGKGDYGMFRLQGVNYRLQEKDGTLYVFRSDGRLGYVEDLNGNRITLLYTGSNLTSLSHSNGAVLTLAYYGTGRIASITDSLGRTTTYDYDASGEHLTEVTEYDGRITHYAYNNTVGSASRHALTAITNPDGTVRNFGYDGHGWLVSTSRNGGTEPVIFGYDGKGTVTSTDALGKTSTFNFDRRGLLVKARNPLGHDVQMAFDDVGNLTSVTDPAGSSHVYAYDAKGNLQQSVDPLGALTRFAYTPDWSRLASVTDANGNPTRYDYDTKGNLAAITYADSSHEDWNYDAAGNAEAWVNRRGAEVGFTYDAAGRVTRKSYTNGTEITYAYDARGNLDQTVDPHGTTDLDYDDKDRLVQITYPGDRWLRFAYDGAGRRTNSVDQLGHTLRYFYDALGRLSHMQDETGTEIVRYQYDVVGRMSRKTLGNGVYTTYEYDAAGQLLHLVNLKPDATVLSRFDYTYDSRGRRTVMDTHYGRWAYGYDDIGQLTRAVLVSTDPDVPSQDLTYIYDKLGNRTKTIENGVTKDYTVNSLNQYTKVGDTTYVFDKDGNLIEERAPEGTTRYAYSDENRLVGITSGAGEWGYVYDALGECVAMNENGEVTHYVVDTLGDLVGEYKATGERISCHDYGLGLVRSKSSFGDLVSFTFDGLGNCSEVLDISAASAGRYSHQPFGSILLDDISGGGLSSFGREHGVRASSTLVHFRTRSYSPQIGRFLNCDKLRHFGGSFNTQQFVGNNPVSFIDPLGLQQWSTEEWSAYRDWMSRRATGEDYTRVAWDHVAWNGRGKWKYHDFTPDGVDVEWQATLDVVCAGFGSDPFPWELAAYTALKAIQIVAASWEDLLSGYSKQATIATLSNVSDPSHWAAIWEAYRDRTEYLDRKIAQIQISRDPNDCIGPAGYGPSNYVAAGALLPYQIRFENHTNAAAPAQAVVITDQLSADLDWSTFRVTEIGFGDQIITVPANTQDFEKQHACKVNGHDILVDIMAGINPATGQAYCRLYTLNPTNGLPPTVDIGLLPPEDGTGRGKGWFSFTIRPKAGLATGTQIRNIALITFDVNEPIATNQIDPQDPTQGTDAAKEALVTIDAAPPVSQMTVLPDTITEDGFTLTWSGQDEAGGSGIRSYTVYVSDNGGAAVPWLTDTAGTNAVFTGAIGHRYAFYVRATDWAGQSEASKAVAEAATTVEMSNYLCDPSSDPALEAAGGYDGYFYAESAFGGGAATAVCGTLNVKVSDAVAGKLTAKAVLQKGSLSFSAKAWTATEADGSFLAEMPGRGGEKLVLHVRQNRVWGTLAGGTVGETLAVDGARNRFADSKDTGAATLLGAFRGYYTVALPVYDGLSLGAAGAAPQGVGYLTVTVGNGGSAKIAGILADGTKVTQSSRLILFDGCGPEACVPVFAPLYAKTGWAGGLLWLTPGHGKVVTDRDRDWLVRWEKPGKGPDGFRLLLDVCGGWYNTVPALASAYLFSAGVGDVPYHYAGGSADWVAMPEDVGVSVAGGRMSIVKGVKPVKQGDGSYTYDGENVTGATLGFTAKTGLFKGKFSLYYDYDVAGRLTHKAVNVPYTGVLTPVRDEVFKDLPVGMGSCLVPDNDAALKAYKIKRSFPVWLEAK